MVRFVFDMQRIPHTVYIAKNQHDIGFGILLGFRVFIPGLVPLLFFDDYKLDIECNEFRFAQQPLPEIGGFTQGFVKASIQN
jgi:hypothetical protein